MSRQWRANISSTGFDPLPLVSLAQLEERDSGDWRWFELPTFSVTISDALQRPCCCWFSYQAVACMMLRLAFIQEGYVRSALVRFRLGGCCFCERGLGTLVAHRMDCIVMFLHPPRQKGPVVIATLKSSMLRLCDSLCSTRGKYMRTLTVLGLLRTRGGGPAASRVSCSCRWPRGVLAG